MTLVTIQLVNNEVMVSPILDVLVEVYNTSHVFQTSGISDVNGEVGFTLADGSYYIYLRKTNVSFLPSQPQTLVVTGPGNNLFRVVGHEKIEPESTNPLRCTVSGTILGINGLGKRNRLIFEPLKDLLILSGNVITPSSRIEIASDDNGYFEFELLRNTKYAAYFLFPQDLFDQQPGKLDTVIPDSPRVNLYSLLFPLPLSVSFTDTNLNLSVGGAMDQSVGVSASFSDGSIRNIVSTAWSGVEIATYDNKIANVSINDNVLLVKPLSTGTITITTVRTISDSVFFDPLPDFSSDSIVITVS